MAGVFAAAGLEGDLPAAGGQRAADGMEGMRQVHPAAVELESALSELWQDVKRIFNETMDWFGGLPARFKTFGAEIIDGLAKGIDGALGSVKTAITEAGESTVRWFKDKLGIKSPSRVFMLAGSEISRGAAEGITRRQHLVRNAALGMAAAATAGLPAQAGSMGDAGRLIDRRAPIAAAAVSPRPVTIAGDTVHITIHAGPGMDAQALARAVSAELDRRQQSKRARVRSSLADID